MKFALWIIAIIVLASVLRLFPSHTQIVELKEENERMETRIATMKGEIANLKDDLNKFKTDPYYLEKVARNELGLAKENEVIVNIEEKDQEGMD
jgi:cell division protein FtsB